MWALGVEFTTGILARVQCSALGVKGAADTQEEAFQQIKVRLLHQLRKPGGSQLLKDFIDAVRPYDGYGIAFTHEEYLNVYLRYILWRDGVNQTSLAALTGKTKAQINNILTGRRAASIRLYADLLDKLGYKINITVEEKPCFS